MNERSQPITRRGVLGALAVMGLSACSTSPGQESRGARGAGGNPSPQPSSAGEATLPPARRYVPLGEEVRPKGKQTAARAIEQALTWTDSQGRDIARRLAHLPNATSIADMLQPLATEDAASVTSVIYPQYGGLNAKLTRASVMLVGRQTLLRQGRERPSVREFVVDVRLTARPSVWDITSATVGITPPPGEPGPEARALLANPRVGIPEPARADLEGAVISPKVAVLLNTLSESWRLDVQVLRTGHPRNVFGTTRVSNHTRGRAVDIWAINGTPVIRAARSLWEPVVKEAARLGSTEVGGPGLPEQSRGLRPVFFTNPTHQDHLHLGFEPDKN